MCSACTSPDWVLRGRTLNDAVIILDEAQNTTTHQIKMFLTRLGMGSKMIITGDMTQIDLPRSTQSGVRLLRRADGTDTSIVHLHLQPFVKTMNDE